MITDLTLRCRCCTPATPLLPRAELAANLAVCPRTGQLHRAEGTSYILIDDNVQTLVSQRTDAVARGPVVRIDLSKEGYA